VDHHYRDDEMELDVVMEDDRGDGMELDIVPGAQDGDDDGRSDGGSAWAPSDGSTSSASPTPAPSSARTSPTPSPPPTPTPSRSPTPASPTVLAALDEIYAPSERSPPPDQDVRDQPFMDQFKLLANVEDQGDVLDGLLARPMDVDRWELVISPEEYLDRFKDSLADIQLRNRAPLRKLHTPYKRGPAFDKYLLIAEATHQLWVDLRYKKPFFNALDEFMDVQEGTLEYQASQGKAHLPTSVFIDCLIAAGCHTIRLKSYGQKMPMTAPFLHNEPAQINHRWAKHNEWDIGTTFVSPYIWLFASATGRRHGIKHFAMCVPGSGDYGSVNVQQSHRGRKFTVKIYPRLVHVIKSFNSHLQGSIPTKLSGVLSQVAGAERMIHSLTGKDAMGLGGFRIEVTVRAVSLREATKVVKRTGFLNPEYWLGLGDGPHAPKLISAKVIDRQAFLDNANWVLQQANSAKVFHGQGANKPSKQHIQALTDILNALGWNGDLRTPTKSLRPNAWWNMVAPAAPSLFGTLAEIYQTDDQIRALFELARANAGRDGIPCKSQPNNPSHRYQVNNGTPFKIRCCMHGCYHRLHRSAIIQWIAELVNQGVIDGAVLEVDGGI